VASDAYEEFFRRAAPVAGAALRKGELLRRYTSFRIGGHADLFLAPPSEDVLSEVLSIAHEASVPVTLIGGGTNLLVSDEGVRGLVVRLGRDFDTRAWSDEAAGSAPADASGKGSEEESGENSSESSSNVLVEVGASTRLGKLVSEAVDRGLAGIEFAAGIPGTVGGGTLMNAGAFGGEIGTAITHARGVAVDGSRVFFGREDLRFSYRKLALDAGVVITSVGFRLSRSSVGKLRRTVDSVQAKRKRKQPLGFPNAGSVFKNPPNEHAGRLIERAGLKGATIGQAQISPDHANFIVNLGGARARDVRGLMSLAQEAVWQRSGLWLEPELRLVGVWDEAEAVSTQI
jgi:UDP-N-acetylmuramate dehydrogenase